jgi:hypothetical protein
MRIWARSVRLLILFLPVAPLVRPAIVEACSIATPPRHVVDPALRATDQTPPDLAALSVARIKRGHGGSGCGGSSCDDIGSVRIAVVVTDEITPRENIGFRLAFVAGTPPQGLVPPPADPFRTDYTNGQIDLSWGDGGTDDQESIDFTVEVVAVDAAGNESGPRTIRVRDGGSGCQVSGTSSLSGTVFSSALIVALFVLLRRPLNGSIVSRRRRACGRRSF